MHNYQPRGRLVAILLLASALFPATGHGQQENQRAAFAALHDSLAEVTDTTQLLALEQRTIAQAKQQRDDPAIHVRLALIAYRLGQLGDGTRHFEDAGSEGEWATELARDWPWAWYVLAQADLALREVPQSGGIGMNGLRQALNVDDQSKALKEFQHTLQLDPTFTPALRGLVDAALSGQRTGHEAEALAAIREGARQGAGESLDFLLTRGEIERQLGQPDSALVSYQRYRARGGDTALALLEEAKTLFVLHRPKQAGVLYDSAAGRLGSDTSVADMRADLAWIADSAELAAYDTLAPGEYGPWIRRFWRERDLADAQPPSERLGEHYRRLFYVLEHFRRPGVYRETDMVYHYHSGQHLVDDRGVVYMRHGPPDETATATGIDVPPNVSWLYHRPEGDIILHFRTASGDRDYRLIESLADLYGFEAAHWLEIGAYDKGPYDNPGGRSCPKESSKCDSWVPLRGVFESRSGLDVRYDKIADGLGTSAALPVLTEIRASGRAGIAVATTTDDDLLRFKHRLPASVQRFGIGTDQGGRILVTIGSAPVIWPRCAGAARPLSPRAYGFYAEGPTGRCSRWTRQRPSPPPRPYRARSASHLDQRPPCGAGPCPPDRGAGAAGTRQPASPDAGSIPIPNLSGDGTHHE